MQIDVDTVRCARHGETFRSGTSCPGCDAAAGASEAPPMPARFDAAARAVRADDAPAANVARKGRGRKPLPTADDYRHAIRVLFARLTTIADKVGDGRKAKNNKAVSRLMSQAKVLGDYTRKALSDGYAMARDREEVDLVERKEAAVRELRRLRAQLRSQPATGGVH
jgi:hypothetical protein